MEVEFYVNVRKTRRWGLLSISFIFVTFQIYRNIFHPTMLESPSKSFSLRF